MVSGKTSVYGLFGFPVEHSFSPGMHNAAFSHLGMDACYVPFAVHPDRLREAVRGIRAMGLQGLNVTVPHKQAVLRHLDELSEEAGMIGAVNTIEIQGNRLVGHNTDGRGFVRSLRDDAGFSPKGKIFLLIGSGGAARALGFSLVLSGAGKVFMTDLDMSKARTLARDIHKKTGGAVEPIAHDRISLPAQEADCIINATPLGLKKSDLLPAPADLIKKGQLVCDLVYNPAETRFLKAAKRRGARCLSGIGMLLYQGVIAFELWTGEQGPVRVMKNALTNQMK